MSLKYLTLTLGAAAAFPQMQITENGVPKTLYVVGPTWFDSVVQNGMAIPHNGKAYLATSDALGPDNFYTPNLLGGSISYDVNLSETGCSCNSALYLVGMPARSRDGDYNAGSQDNYYCDANEYGGTFCPEFDIMEANTYTWHTTAHKCDPPTDGFYSDCDKGGNCIQDTWEKIRGQYGPGDQYTINTLNTFHVDMSWSTDAHFTVRFTQEGRTASMESDSSCDWYVSQMEQDLAAGMVMVLSNWGDTQSTMDWLDQETGCQGVCDNNPTMHITNIAYTTNQDTDNAYTVNEGYDFGKACETNQEQDCSLVDNCKSCLWSWPKSDPLQWNSKEAQCRCKLSNSYDEQTYMAAISEKTSSMMIEHVGHSIDISPEDIARIQKNTQKLGSEGAVDCSRYENEPELLLLCQQGHMIPGRLLSTPFVKPSDVTPSKSCAKVKLVMENVMQHVKVDGDWVDKNSLSPMLDSLLNVMVDYIQCTMSDVADEDDYTIVKKYSDFIQQVREQIYGERRMLSTQNGGPDCQKYQQVLAAFEVCIGGYELIAQHAEHSVQTASDHCSSSTKKIKQNQDSQGSKVDLTVEEMHEQLGCIGHITRVVGANAAFIAMDDHRDVQQQRRQLDENSLLPNRKDLSINEGVEAVIMYVQGFHITIDQEAFIEAQSNMQCMHDIEDFSKELMDQVNVYKTFINNIKSQSKDQIISWLKEEMTKLDETLLRFADSDCGSAIFSETTRAKIYQIYEEAKNADFTVEETTTDDTPLIYVNGIKLDFANFFMLYSKHFDIIQTQKEKALMTGRLLASNENMQNNHWHMLGKTHAYQMKAMELVQNAKKVTGPSPDQNNTTLILALIFSGLTLLVLIYAAFYFISHRRKQVEQPTSEEAKVADIDI